jgi:pimeloyl-ACP methyl ester carboxylesterase
MSLDWKSLYPFSSHEIRIGGHRYHYVDEGQGEPQLLVHGNPTWSLMWRNLILAFRDRYRVIAVDHLGCGLSDKPQDYPYCLRQHIDNLSQLVRTLDLDNITLIAHDWGGAIGVGAALKTPDRFARIVLSNTAAFRSPHIPWQVSFARTPILGTLAIRGLNLFLRGTLRSALEKPERITRQVRAGYFAPYRSWHDRVAIDRFVKDIPRSPRHPSYDTLVRVEQNLPRLADRPWLLVWGMRDWCFHDWYLNRFLDFVPQAEVCRLPDAGHLIMEDATDQVIQAVDQFLTTTACPQASTSASPKSS